MVTLALLTGKRDDMVIDVSLAEVKATWRLKSLHSDDCDSFGVDSASLEDPHRVNYVGSKDHDRLPVEGNMWPFLLSENCRVLWDRALPTSSRQHVFVSISAQ